MRAWFKAGPLDGYECNLSVSAELAPKELSVCLREMNFFAEPAVIEHGCIATYAHIPETDGGYQVLR